MITKKTNSRDRSKTKIRKKVFGTKEKPRLSVYRSLNYVYGQLIDDLDGKTLLTVSSLTGELKEELKNIKGKTAKSKLVGKYLAQKAKELEIEGCIFDRNGFRYHGRIKALAEGAREGGLKF
ncbi:MAG: 50S ribosomal protein L18 [Ignavibacteriales bacterium]|jgi:large subunit ribosomal protein L18|nr:50S ribosomal protein L18 [Ignavibacteriaceae bacterium]NLH62113.1 50S ribosomal protein L18 [Ignavibacteriales bacterium]HOJ17813.1 50S ribosomal protein L18 [Ignavibacteriaceae bacterium]